MAQLLVDINESLVLSGSEKGGLTRQRINGINNFDRRRMQLTSGSIKSIWDFDARPAAGTFVTSSFKYGRITNISNNPTINRHDFPFICSPKVVNFCNLLLQYSTSDSGPSSVPSLARSASSI